MSIPWASLDRVPRRGVVVVTCMDVRVDPLRLLGLEPGDAHVLRNAGGVVTDDVLRSLVLSQRLLGTRRVHLLHHTDCGLQGLDEDALTAAVAADAGRAPPFAFGRFDDAAADVRRCAALLAESPFLRLEELDGWVLDVAEPRLHRVELR